MNFPILLHKKKKSPPALTFLISVIAVISPLMTFPQVQLIYTTQDASGVSFTTWLFYVVTSAIWLWFGIVHKEKPIIVNSCIGGILSAAVVIGVYLYSSTSP